VIYLQSLSFYSGNTRIKLEYSQATEAPHSIPIPMLINTR